MKNIWTLIIIVVLCLAGYFIYNNKFTHQATKGESLVSVTQTPAEFEPLRVTGVLEVQDEVKSIIKGGAGCLRFIQKEARLQVGTIYKEINNPTFPYNIDLLFEKKAPPGFLGIDYYYHSCADLGKAFTAKTKTNPDGSIRPVSYLQIPIASSTITPGKPRLIDLGKLVYLDISNIEPFLKTKNLKDLCGDADGYDVTGQIKLSHQLQKKIQEAGVDNLKNLRVLLNNENALTDESLGKNIIPINNKFLNGEKLSFKTHTKELNTLLQFRLVDDTFKAENTAYINKTSVYSKDFLKGSCMKKKNIELVVFDQEEKNKDVFEELRKPF